MRVLIAGTGAVGGYFGALLVRGGRDVTFLARGAHAAAMRERGLAIASWREGEFTVRAPVVTTLEEAAARGPFDLVIVGVKWLTLDQLKRELADAGPRILGERG